MKRPDYANVNTLIRVYETSLLTSQRKAALLHAEDAAAVIRLLQEWRFFRFASPEQEGELLSREKAGWLLWIRQAAPETGAAEYFSLQDTVHNLKVFLKEQATGQALDGLYIPDILMDREALPLLLKGGAPGSELEERLRESALEALEKYRLHGSLAYIDFELDRLYYGELRRIAEKTGDGNVAELTASAIDLYHLSLLLQGRRAGIRVPSDAVSAGGYLDDRLDKLFFLPEAEQNLLLQESRYGTLFKRADEHGEETPFDVLADDYLLELCKRAKLQPFGVFPIYSFLFARLRELRTVRLLLTGKKAGLPEKELSKRLGIAYEL